MIEKTFVMIKPDGVQRGLVGEITKRFENAGLKIIAMKMVWIDDEFSKEHYKALLNKKFYPFLEEMITEGPVVAMVLEGIHVVEIVRKIVGDTEPRSAVPGTIRGDFSHHSYDYSDKKKIAVKNVVHASGNKKDATDEIKLWFSNKEMHSYERSDEKHTL